MGGVSEAWTAEDETELNYLLAENLAEVDGSIAKRAPDVRMAVGLWSPASGS